MSDASRPSKMQQKEMETQLSSLCEAKSPSLEKIKRLLKEEIDCNLKESTSLVVLSQNRTAYDQDDYVDLVRLLIHHKVGVNVKNNNGENALHYLCRHYVKDDLPDIVRLLISGGIDVNSRDKDGENAIFHLTQNRIEIDKVFKILLRHGIGYCHDRCADNCFKKLDGLCDAEVISVLRFWAEEDITLGWHLKCDDCKQILSIKTKERREWQHHQLCNNTYSVFHMICKDLRNWASGQDAIVTHFDGLEPVKWLMENPVLKTAMKETQFDGLIEISDQVKVAAEDSNFNCDMFERFMRTLRSIAVKIGGQSTKDQIEWFHLLPFDEPNLQMVKEVEWEKTLFDLAHKDYDNFFGKFVKKCARERIYSSGIYSHKCHGSS